MIQIPDDIVWEIGLCLIRRAKDVQKAWVRDVVHLSLVNRRFREILRQLCYHSFDDQWFRRKVPLETSLVGMIPVAYSVIRS